MSRCSRSKARAIPAGRLLDQIAHHPQWQQVSLALFLITVRLPSWVLCMPRDNTDFEQTGLYFIRLVFINKAFIDQTMGLEVISAKLCTS